MEDYMIEKELTLPPPRTVHPKASWWGERLFGFALLIAFPVANVCMWTYGVQRIHSLRDRGQVVQGVVEGLYEEHGKSTSYDVVYTFTDEHGDGHHGHRQISEASYQSLEEGGPVEVTYLPDNPEVSRPWRVEDGHVTTMDGEALVLFLLSAPVLVGCFIACEKDVRKHYYLGERGTAVTGEVTGFREVRGKHTDYKVAYSFKDLFGNAYSKEVSVRKAFYDSLSTGSPLTILYDPERPQVSLLYTQLKVSVG